MNTAYCNPNRLKTPSKKSAERTGKSLIAKWNPCTRLFSGDSWLRLRPFDLHHQQCYDPEPVQEKTPALSYPPNRKSGDRWAYDARATKDRRIQRNRVWQIFSPDHLNQKSLPDRHVKRVDHTHQECNHDDHPGAPPVAYLSGQG